MEFKNKEAFDKGVAAQKGDGYGLACYDYASAWADLMEKRMKKGEALAEIAKDASHEADIDGITGFMYGMSVSILSDCWTHGEELRQWHNIDTQIRDEGTKANKDGGCLNPAVISIG
jgi:hypothetical protein